jgi:hypothetical protein
VAVTVVATPAAVPLRLLLHLRLPASIDSSRQLVG